MKKIENWENITESGLKLVPGPQPCKITAVVDEEEKQYLRVEFEIVSGPYKGYFQELFNSSGKWSGFLNRSYKETAVKFFKSFITAVEKSNPKFKWDWNEQNLVGNYVYVNFREEEYVNKDKEIAVFVAPFEFRSIDAFKQGKIETAPKLCLTEDEKKKLGFKPTDTASGVVVPDTIDDEDLPF